MPGLKHALVTGGAGFIGLHLVDVLLKEGLKVRVLDPAVKDRPMAAGAQRIEGSILDPNALKRAAKGVDCVFHLAALAHLWARDKKQYQAVNVEGTRAVLAAAREAKVKRVVVTSTETILRGWRDASAFPITEDDPVPMLDEMAGPYTRSKHRADQLVQEEAARGLDVVSLYPTVPVGPGDYALTAPSRMVLDFVRGKTPAYLNAALNFVAVEDAARSHYLAAQLAPAGGRYIVGGENLAMASFLDLLEAASGKRMPRRKVPYDLALAVATVSELLSNTITRKAPAASKEGVRLALNPSFVSTEKAKAELGFEAGPVADALARQVAWFRKKGLA